MEASIVARESLNVLLASSADAVAQPLRRKRAPDAAAVSAPASSVGGVVFETPLVTKVAAWAALAATDDGSDAPTVRMIDEDALLAGDGFLAPVLNENDAAGCAPKRKACANCSCGCVFGGGVRSARSELKR